MPQSPCRWHLAVFVTGKHRCYFELLTSCKRELLRIKQGEGSKKFSLILSVLGYCHLICLSNLGLEDGVPVLLADMTPCVNQDVNLES